PFRWLPSYRPSSIGFRVTLGGIFFILGTAIIGLAAIDAQVNLLMLIFGMCVGGILINAFHGWRTLRSLTVRRVVPDVAVAGQVFVIRYAVTNRRRWGSARSILIRDVLSRRAPLASPEAFVPILRPGETITLSTPVACHARGRLAFSRIMLATRSPFHLFNKWLLHDHRQEVIIFPALGRLITEIRAASRATDATGGTGATGHIKGDEEYYGVREYRAGDNPRRIHWRRSARTGQLMIREMAQARGDQMWCVLDTRVDSGDSVQIHRLESAISAAATLICDALEGGARIGLICNGHPWVVLPPGSGRAYRPRLLSELAVRSLNTDDDLSSHIRRLAWPVRWHGPCFLFGATESEDLRESASALSRAIGAVNVYIPGSAEFDALFQPARVMDSGMTSDPRKSRGSSDRAPVGMEMS
ncbi:MAG: DUF58 domain-containing protein, partial [Phycisphaerae bacterium]